jgi:TonB family protein
MTARTYFYVSLPSAGQDPDPLYKCVRALPGGVEGRHANACGARRPRLAFGQAGLVVLAHVALLLMLAGVVVPQPPPAHDRPGFALLFVRPAAPATPATTYPAPPLAVPPAIAPPVRAAPPVHATPRFQHFAAPAPRRSPAPPPPAPPQTGFATAPAPASHTKAIVAPDDGAALARLRGAISEAVRAVAEMPLSARLQRRAGRAQVGFAYQDGTVADATLLQSSQSRVLDQAALTAVMRARYPSPPATLRGRRLSLQVWVDFTIGAQTPS